MIIHRHDGTQEKASESEGPPSEEIGTLPEGENSQKPAKAGGLVVVQPGYDL